VHPIGHRRYTLTAGLAIRTYVRRTLMSGGYTFTEDKGFLSSCFVITGLTDHQVRVFDAWVARINADD
jgi:hypothetical protein